MQSFQILTSIRIGPRTTRHRKGEGRTKVDSYYRIYGIALTSILVRNAIKRVIQVVIVTPPVPRGTHFSPSGGTCASLGRKGNFPGSLACAATERAALGRRGGWRRVGERRPVRGWSLKVRGTGLIGLMGLRRESGGVGLGSGAALLRVGVHFRFQAAHARCNRRPPGFLFPDRWHRRQGSRMRPLVKFLPRVGSTTTTPVSVAGGKRVSPPPSLVDHHHCRFPGHHRVPYRSYVSSATLVPTPELEITGRVTRGRNSTRESILSDVAL